MLGQFLRKQRKAAGLSQPKLAALTGIPQTYISRIERGEVDLPQRATREKFHAVLGTTERDWLDAAGKFDTDDNESPPVPAVPGPALARDSDRLPVAEMVRQVEAWPGDTFTQRREANKVRLAGKPGAYERWCVRLFRMWEMNADMVFGIIDDQPA